MHFVYMIECINGHYYTGYTTNLERRYQEHVRGTNKCRYTRSFPPKNLIAFWAFETRSAALRAENNIKKLSKQQKKSLIEEHSEYKEKS